MPKPLPRWVAHTGLDYTVVMLGDETTDNASLRVFGSNPEELGKLVADALNLMADLAVAKGVLEAPEPRQRSKTFFEVHVHRGGSTFAYSASEYPTRDDAKAEARRLRAGGEGAMEIHEVTTTRSSQLASVIPADANI